MSTSSEDELLDSFDEMIEAAAKEMTPEEFRKIAQTSKATIDRAIERHSRKRS
jgi:hypothetical protein